MGAAREPVRVKIADEERGLEEDQAGDPHGGRSAEDGQQLLGRDGLDHEQKEGGEEDRGGKKYTQMGHPIPQVSDSAMVAADERGRTRGE